MAVCERDVEQHDHGAHGEIRERLSDPIGELPHGEGGAVQTWRQRERAVSAIEWAREWAHARTARAHLSEHVALRIAHVDCKFLVTCGSKTTRRSVTPRRSR